MNDSYSVKPTMFIFHSVFPPRYPERKFHPTTKENLNRWISINADLNLHQVIHCWGEAVSTVEDFSKSTGINCIKWFLNESDGRFASDLWRLIVLYMYGGFYADIDQEPLSPITSFLDLEITDFCAASNMGRHIISTGFLWAKKGCPIVLESILEIRRRYESGGDRGGMHAMGEVITRIGGGQPHMMPIGRHMIGDSDCFFLHEVADHRFHDSQTFEYLEGFYLLTPFGQRIMNSRYRGYLRFQHDKSSFIKL